MKYDVIFIMLPDHINYLPTFWDIFEATIPYCSLMYYLLFYKVAT